MLNNCKKPEHYIIICEEMESFGRFFLIKNLLGKLNNLLKNTHLTIEKNQYNVIKNKSV